MKKSFFSADTANFSILTPCSIHSVVVFLWYLFMKLYAALERGTTNVFLINTGAIKLYHILDGSFYSFWGCNANSCHIMVLRGYNSDANRL